MIRLPGTGWCPPGGCTARQAAELEHAAALAFESGRAYERAELAETEATWRPLARKTYEQQVAERIAEMERHAARQGWNTWRGQYPGGVIDYDTGLLAKQLEAAA